MSRLPDNPSPKGERGEERFGEETVGDLVSAHTSQGLVCSCHGHPDCQGHPILEPDALWVHFHPVQELRKWLLCWSSHLLCSLGAVSPALFRDVLQSQRLADHFKTWYCSKKPDRCILKIPWTFFIFAKLVPQLCHPKSGNLPTKEFCRNRHDEHDINMRTDTGLQFFIYLLPVCFQKDLSGFIKKKKQYTKQPSFFSLNIFNWSSFSQVPSQWGCVHFLFSRIPY